MEEQDTESRSSACSGSMARKKQTSLGRVAFLVLLTLGALVALFSGTLAGWNDTSSRSQQYGVGERPNIVVDKNGYVRPRKTQEHFVVSSLPVLREQHKLSFKSLKRSSTNKEDNEKEDILLPFLHQHAMGDDENLDPDERILRQKNSKHDKKSKITKKGSKSSKQSASSTSRSSEDDNSSSGGFAVPSTSVEPSPESSLHTTWFQSIVDVPGAELLLKGPECYLPAQEVQLPFVFNWLGLEYTTLFVEGNGNIRFDIESVSGWPCFPEYYVENIDCGGIAVAQIEPAHETCEGQLWAFHNAAKNSFAVTWEDIIFDGYGKISLNAQVTLYPQGDVDICWGKVSGPGPKFRASISDKALLDLQDSPYKQYEFPVTGDPFDDEGVVKSGDWPLNQCRYFRTDIPGWVSTQ